MNMAYALFNFQGRLRRRDFWLGVLAVWVAHTILNYIVITVMPPPLVILSGDAWVQWASFRHFSAGQWVVHLLLLWPTLALNVKRCHDRGKSGWWTLVVCIPVLGWLWWLIDLGLLDGAPGPNEYGPSPKALAA